MRLKFLLFTLLITALSFSQKATVSGVILDKEFNNEPLAFANIMIKGTTIGTSTDENGKYTLSVSPGSHTLIIGFLGYKSVEIPITVKANERKVVNYTLESEGVMLEDVIVSVAANNESEQALLQEQQKAVEIKQAIGAEEISKKGISDVAAAVAKTTGISKQEGGSDGIFVRGLGDRYNATTMNGLPLPSNNPSKKNINLEIFSTDIVEYIGIDKTYNYKNYGDFAGANIDIVSKNYKGSGILEIGTGTGINSNAIKQNKFYLQDGPNFHGFSNEAIPNNPLAAYNFTTSWDKEASTPVNGSFFLRGGDSYSVGNNGKLSFFINTSFDNNYTFKEGIRRGSVSYQGVARKDFNRISYEYQTSTNIMGNVNYKINNNNTVKYNSMFINSTSQKHEEFRGIVDIFDNAGQGFIRRSTFDRTHLLVNQLLGDHKFGEKINLDWGLSYNMLTNVIPDRMQNTFVPNTDNTGLVSSDINQSDNNRYSQNLTDNEIAANLSASYKFNKTDDDYKGKLILGFSGRSKKINFDATQFNFKIFDNTPIIDLNNIDAYFNQSNYGSIYEIRTFRGNVNTPNALAPQTYSGNQDITAGFGAIEYKLSDKLFVIAGLRAEMITQDITYDTSLKKGKNKFDTTEFLPTLTAKYELNEKQNLKLAASKTYTLPQFKERAPFLYEEVGQSYIGNPDLYNSTDYNVDIKWELFPQKGEVISLTGFGKYIQNPINEITVSSATNDISWANTGDNAIGVGAEFELRKKILNTENSTTNKNTNLSAGLNVSYLHTEQDLDAQKVDNETEITFAPTNKKSRLSGASDLLVNADISFSKDFSQEKSLTTTLSASYFSDRVYAIGVTKKGNLVDSAVISLDYILKYQINKNISFGLSAKNLLNPTIERKQETQNVVVDSYKKGRNYGFSLKYTF